MNSLERIHSPLLLSDNDIQGAEIEYAFVDSAGLPVGEIDGVELLSALHTVVAGDRMLKNTVGALGGFNQEVFKHQIEVNTKKGTLSEVLRNALELHDILEKVMKEQFGLVMSDEDILPFPGGGSELLSEQNYFVESMTKVNRIGLMDTYVTDNKYFRGGVMKILEGIEDPLDRDFSFAWNASTCSIHLHRSLNHFMETMKLRYAQTHNVSCAIKDDPESWWKHWGMSQLRKECRSKIVGVRAIIGEAACGFDDIVIPEVKDDWYEFVCDRFFSTGLSSKPTRDHTAYAIKCPGGVTTEGRTANGPGTDKNAIKRAFEMYRNKDNEAAERFNRSGIIH